MPGGTVVWPNLKLKKASHLKSVLLLHNGVKYFWILENCDNKCPMAVLCDRIWNWKKKSHLESVLCIAIAQWSQINSEIEFEKPKSDGYKGYVLFLGQFWIPINQNHGGRNHRFLLPFHSKILYNCVNSYIKLFGKQKIGFFGHF